MTRNRVWPLLKHCFNVLILTIGSLNGGIAFSSPAGMHTSAEKSTLNRKTNVLTLKGRAALFRDLEELHGDEIKVYLDTDQVWARGNVSFQYGNVLINAEEIDFNLKTKIGTVRNGSLTNGQLAVRGEEMNLLGENRLKVTDYEYTTCIDCPGAWAVTGSEADIEVEGYAKISNFVFKVKDASVLWFPFMILPMKTKRQSGLLFPRWGINEVQGPFFVQPYFWAINDSADMTFGMGTYTRRGLRLEGEARYSLTPRSQGNFNFYFTRDGSGDPRLAPNISNRVAGKIQVTQELPFGIEGKLRWFEVSDSGYPIIFNEDLPGRYEPVLASDLFFYRNDPNLSATVSMKRIRNLLFFNDDRQFQKGFDAATVQEVPAVVVNTNDQFLFGSPVVAGLEARYNRFIRGDGPFDTNPLSTSVDATDSNNLTIREASRLSLIPKLYMTLNPLPWLSVVPSAQFFSFFYSFGNAFDGKDRYSDLKRGYLLTQAEASFQVEKVFKTDSGNAYKNTIRPMLTYSRIPVVQQPGEHPFIDRIQNLGSIGQYFDNYDIVPLGVSQNLENYFTPLGNSLSAGVVSQLFEKKGSASIQRIVEVSARQTIDFRETEKGDAGIPLSPLFSQILFERGGLSWSNSYTYFFYLERYREARLTSNPSPHRYSSTLMWTFQREVKNSYLQFERSLSLNYLFSRLTTRVSALSIRGTYSINDYLMPSVALSYDLFSKNQRLLESRYGLRYQSPSQCWHIDGMLTRSIDRGSGILLSFGLNLGGNLAASPEPLQN